MPLRGGLLGFPGRPGLILCVVALAAACGGNGASPGSGDGGADGAHEAGHDAGRDAGTDGATDATADGADGAGADSGGDGGASPEALNPTVATNLAFSSAFLYTGPGAVQTGVAAGTIDVTRVSVIRGQVLVHSTAPGSSNGVAPSPGVTVAVLGHPEFGTTTTQSDGWFSLAVNGGGVLTVTFEASGYLAVQRRVTTRWLEYAIANAVVLTAPEPGTPVTLSASSTAFQVVRGLTHGTAATLTPTEDADGARTATVLIPPGTTASIGGLNDAVTTLRATELTTGSTGLQAMPGDLPPTSAYTYAVDLSIDEANGAPVTFSQPVLFYVENFIGFPVGDGTHPTAVPSGYYDTTKGTWVPTPSGQVVKVLTNAGGTVTLDTVGNGQDTPDSAFTPPLVAGERAQMAALYKAGTSFWRVGVPHFCPYDYNWAPSGAEPPDVPGSNGNAPDDNPCPTCGSIIESENQILAEQFPVVGTPFGLRYQSERTAGRQVTVQIPVTGATPAPSTVEVIHLIVETQGRQWTFDSTSLAANQAITWTWDRKDAYGRTVSGHSDVQVKIGYQYQGVPSYQTTSQFGIFASGSTPVTGNRALGQVTIWKYESFPVDQIDASSTFGLGGLSLTAHHLYDSFGQTFYGGDGTRRTVDGSHFTTIATYAGGGTGDATGVAATTVGLNPSHIAMGADGTLFIADSTYLRAVDPKTQLITTVAGNGATEANTSGNPGDGQPATSVAVSAYGVAVAPDGSVYVTTGYTNRVRRIDAVTGIITTVAGSGNAAESCAAGTACSDGQKATTAPLAALGGVAVGPDGCVYFAEQFGGATGGRVRKVELDGTLKTVIDNLSSPDGLAFGPDGSLYAVDNTSDNVVRLDPSGTRTVVAGAGRGYAGDGAAATQALLFRPVDIAVADDGSFYVSDTLNFVLRYVDTKGIIHTLTNPSSATLATSQVTDDNGPAGAAVLYEPTGLAIGPGHALYVADSIHGRVRVIRPPLPGFGLADALIPSTDGSVVYHFDPTGRHLHTYDALRGQTLATMAYDASGLLSSVTDNAGNVTSIDRSQAGKVVLNAPFGQQTTIALDASGYAASITNPNQEATQFTYELTGTAENGLLSTLTDPKGQVHKFSYSPDGLLTEDDNPAGGQQSIARSFQTSGWTTQFTTKMGYVSSFAISTPAVGGWERDITGPTGAVSNYVEGVDGTQTTTSNDLTGKPLETTAVQLAPDPRYAMVAPYASSTTRTLQPSGLAMTTTVSRTASVGTNLFDLQTSTEVVTVNPGAATPQVTTTTYTAGATTNTRVVQTATGRTVTETLDANDRVIAVAIPGLAPRSFTYNTSPCAGGGGEGCGGRLVSVTATSAADGTRTWTNHYQYAPDTGFASSAVDALGQTTSWSRDLVGRILQTQLPDLVGTTDPENQVVTHYDPNGNLASLAVPSVTSPAPTHTFPLYSGEDDLETYTPPPLTPALTTTSTSYSYNADRQLMTTQYPEDATSRPLGRTYDAVGRLHTIDDAKSGVTSTFAFAPSGLPQSVTTSDGQVITYGYGVDGPLLMSRTWSGTVSGSVAFTHDSFLRVASRAVDNGTPLNLLYDADGLFQGMSGLAGFTVSRDYQGKNGLVTGTTLGGITDAYTYDGFGEVKTYTASYGGSSLYAYQVTSRDSLGRIQTLSETLGATSHAWGFTYDAHGDLDSATEDGVKTSYSYDTNGNRLTAGGATSTYDAQDRLLTSPGASYTYTNNGDLLTKVTAAGTASFTYDLQSSLRAVTLPNGDTVAYVIDGERHRVERTWTHGGQKVVQGFLYDDALRIAAELDGSGSVVSTFGYGLQVNVPDVMVRGGKTYRVLTDWRGSVRAVVDAGSGSVVETVDYDAWGTATVSDSTCAEGAVCAIWQPFGFAGGVFDRETGFVRFGARDYDASVGRWTQKDPIGFGGGQENIYAYADDDPVNLVDPTGTDPFSCAAPKPKCSAGIGPAPTHFPGETRGACISAWNHYQSWESSLCWSECTFKPQAQDCEAKVTTASIAGLRGCGSLPP